MSNAELVFHHIHIISEDPRVAAGWYADMLGGEVGAESELQGAPQISVALDGVNLLIRGKRPGEEPDHQNLLRHYPNHASHNQWGTDHFGFSVYGDLDDFCDRLKEKGATFSVEPYDFTPETRIAYLSAPDNVSIELFQPAA